MSLQGATGATDVLVVFDDLPFVGVLLPVDYDFASGGGRPGRARSAL